MTAFRDYSVSAAANVSIGGINTAEGMARSDVNNALRQLAADGKALSNDVTASARFYGATGDGTTDDRGAFVVADAAGPFVVTPGTYKIASNLTIANDVRFESGASIVVPTGVTVTFAGSFMAGLYTVFTTTGTGAVLLDPAKNVVRYPEWWGATEAADCTAAIIAAMKSGTETVLQVRDYVVSATLPVPAYAWLRGSGHDYEGDDTASRILMTNNSATIIQLGSTGTPVDINSAPAAARISDLYVSRNVAPAAGSVGIAVGWSRFARLDHVRSAESIAGFRFTNSVFCVGKNLHAKRTGAINTGTDQFIGFDIDGTGALPAAGGNASLWLYSPQAELNLTITDSAAFRYTGRFTDCFLLDPESVSFSYSLNIQGDATGTPTASTNTNLTIIHPIFDACKIRSIRIDNVNKWGSIKINEPYIGPAATAEALRATNCDGHIGIYGGHVRMGSTAAAGFVFDDCRGPVVDKVAFGECTAQAVALNVVAGGYIAPVTINATGVLAAAVQAIATVTDCTIEPFCQGDAAKVGIGYQSLASSNDYNTIRTTGMTRAAVSAKYTLAAGAEANSSIIGPDGSQTKFGYATGAGGTVAQATSKSTGVTLNKVSGQITMNAASLAAATSVSFTLTNSQIAATDVVNVSIASGATVDAYTVTVTATAAGSCRIQLRNESGGALAEAVVLNFVVIKGVSA